MLKDIAYFLVETQAFIATQKAWMAARKKMLDELK